MQGCTSRAVPSTHRRCCVFATPTWRRSPPGGRTPSSCTWWTWRGAPGASRRRSPTGPGSATRLPAPRPSWASRCGTGCSGSSTSSRQRGLTMQRSRGVSRSFCFFDIAARVTTCTDLPAQLPVPRSVAGTGAWEASLAGFPDFPGFPVRPRGPGAPSTPSVPGRPGAPGEPVSPVGPCSPWSWSWNAVTAPAAPPKPNTSARTQVSTILPMQETVKPGRRARQENQYKRTSRTCAGPLPAAFAPLPEMGPLLTERRVVPVARVEPRLVRQPVEDLLLQVVHQRGEVRRVRGPARSAREQGVPGEQVRGPLGVVVQQRDGARRVAGEADDLEAALAERDRVAVLDPP